MSISTEKANRAEALFRSRGGLLRTSEALELGLHPRTLYHLRDTGRLEQLSRGVYRLASLPPLEEPDLTVVSARAPEAVICLLSALDFHELSVEVPHEVYLALPRGRKAPKLEHPPLRVFHFSGPAYREGVEIHELGGAEVKIYSPVKTVADCFKFRNQIGKGVAIEALKAYLERPEASLRALLSCARICRVEAVMQPYLEALL